MHKSSALIVGLLLLASCSKVNHLTDTANNLDKNTASLSKNTKSVDETSGTMFEQFRSKESEEARARKFREIIDDKGPKAMRFGTKSNNAVVYYEAFEFQLWTGGTTDFDTRSKRTVMLEDAANEFTRRLCDLYDVIKVNKMSPTYSIENHNEDFAFYAMAVAMHYNHSYQKDQAVTKGFEVQSFYDLVKLALTLDHKNKNMEHHLAILVQGENKEIMIELLKARVDMVSALALKMLTDKKSMSIGQKLKALLFKGSFGALGTLDLPEVYPQSNQATRDRVIELLDGAVKTKEFLGTIGVEKKLEKNLYSAYSNISLSTGDKVEEGQPAVMDADKQRALDLISKLMN